MELSRISAAGGQPQDLGLLAARQKGMYNTDLRLRPDGRQIIFSAGWPKGEVWVMENLLPTLRAAR